MLEPFRDNILFVFTSSTGSGIKSYFDVHAHVHVHVHVHVQSHRRRTVYLSKFNLS